MSAYRPRHGYRQALSWPRPEWERPFTTHLYRGRHRADEAPVEARPLVLTSVSS